MPSIIALCVIALAGGACNDGGVTSIDERTGAVTGIAFIDRDANGALGPGDGFAPGVTAALVLDATGDTVKQTTTKVDGSFIMDRIPIGQYRLVAGRGTLGDTVEVMTIPNATITLAAGDTAIRVVPLGYPTVSIATVRTLPAGRRVMLRGIALNGWTAFADSTVHVSDATGAIRAVRTQPVPLQAGDSINILGTTGVNGGSIVLADASAQVLAAAIGLPPLDSIGTGVAAAAAGGVRVDGQVRVAGAVVLDSATVAGDRILGVDDGSGRLEVVLDKDVVFNAGAYVPGATFAGAGVLVPGSAGSWRLKPRNRDEAAITFTVVTTATARTLAAGMRVAIEGIALNGWAAFADSTVHVLDATGALRAVRVLGSVAAGDSVRLLGLIATRDGQPVLTGVTATTLVSGVGIPMPDSVATGTAAGAHGGARDAGQVRIGGQITGTQNLPAGDVILTVNDGSGPIEVFMDKDVAFNPGPYQAGAMLRASGVLVPTGTGSWRLKPRTRDDASAFYPTVTVAEARGLQVGQTVELFGTALNSRSAFGDATVHLEDATGSIRILNVAPSPQVLQGYTIRIVGTIAVHNTQPVLSAQSITQVTVGSLQTPDSVSTQTAASAGSGARDAGQVAVSGAVSAVGTNSSGDTVLTISDGTGPLAVVLDRDIFQSNPYSVGNQIRARGVLVPNSGGTAWELKPRALSEVALN